MLQYFFQCVKLPVTREAHVHWGTFHGCQMIRNGKTFHEQGNNEQQIQIKVKQFTKLSMLSIWIPRCETSRCLPTSALHQKLDCEHCPLLMKRHDCMHYRDNSLNTSAKGLTLVLPRWLTITEPRLIVMLKTPVASSLGRDLANSFYQSAISWTTSKTALPSIRNWKHSLAYAEWDHNKTRIIPLTGY